MPVGRRPQWRFLAELAKRQATLISFRLIRDPDTEEVLSTLYQHLALHKGSLAELTQ
jgi:hypothetical protein